MNDARRQLVAENKRLKDEVAELKATLHLSGIRLRSNEDGLDARDALLRKLTSALHEYGDHKYSCRSDDGLLCDCGFDEIERMAK